MYLGKGFQTTPKPYAFDGYPYLATFIVPNLYHIILLPAGLSAGELREIARRQFEANRLVTYLFMSSQECIRFHVDGSPPKTDSPPLSDGWATDKLLPSKEFQMIEELQQRRVRLLELIARESKKRRWYLAGDLTKGGRPLYKYKLNANYYNAEDGQIWHVPAFSAFNHRCPDLK